MFGKIKTFIKRHPAISVYLILCAVFGLMRVCGLPKVMMDLDVFVWIASLGVTFALGVLTTLKYKAQIDMFIKKHFGEWLKKKGFSIKINHLDYLFNDVELKRLASSIKNTGKFKLIGWEEDARARIANEFCKEDSGEMELTSTKLAAIIAYSLADGTSRVQNMEVICDSIMNLLLNPRTYTVIEMYDPDDNSEELELDIDPQKTVMGKKVELSDRNLILLRQEIISELMNFAVAPMNEHRMNLMAEQFQNAVNYRGAFKS